MIQEKKDKPKKPPTAFGYTPKRKTAYWRVEYLKRISKCNTPDLVCADLGYCWSSIIQARQDPEFKQAEEFANKLYQDKIYKEVEEMVQDIPALKFKFAERVVDRLKNDVPTINIDQSKKNVTLLGISQEQIYEQTKKLLAMAGSHNKSIECKTDLSGAFIDIESKAIRH
jgi:hypothetical protein